MTKRQSDDDDDDNNNLPVWLLPLILRVAIWVPSMPHPWRPRNPDLRSSFKEFDSNIPERLGLSNSPKFLLSAVTTSFSGINALIVACWSFAYLYRDLQWNLKDVDIFTRRLIIYSFWKRSAVKVGRDSSNLRLRSFHHHLNTFCLFLPSSASNVARKPGTSRAHHQPSLSRHVPYLNNRNRLDTWHDRYTANIELN